MEEHKLVLRKQTPPKDVALKDSLPWCSRATYPFGQRCVCLLLSRHLSGYQALCCCACAHFISVNTFVCRTMILLWMLCHCWCCLSSRSLSIVGEQRLRPMVLWLTLSRISKFFKNAGLVVWALLWGRHFKNLATKGSIEEEPLFRQTLSRGPNTKASPPSTRRSNQNIKDLMPGRAFEVTNYGHQINTFGGRGRPSVKQCL